VLREPGAENIKVGVRVSLIKSGDKFSGFKYNLTT
jgi:hypothetical protein